MPRLSVSLDGGVLQALATRANDERRSTSAMAALLIERALSEGGAGAETAVQAEPRAAGKGEVHSVESSPAPPSESALDPLLNVPGVQRASELVPPEIVSEPFEETP